MNIDLHSTNAHIREKQEISGNAGDFLLFVIYFFTMSVFSLSTITGMQR